jgi:hypothetical protein
LKISKRYSEAIKRRTNNTMSKRKKTNNTMAKRKKTNNTMAKRKKSNNDLQNIKQKAKDRATRTPLKSGANSCSPKRSAVPAPYHLALVVLF